MKASDTLFSAASRRKVYQFFGRRVDAVTAEDLTQETFLRAWRKRESVRDAGREEGWLFAIARRVLTDQYRGARRVQDDGIDPDLLETAESEGALTPFRAELLECLERCRDDLSDDAELIFRPMLRGESQAEIARRLGLPVSSVKSRVQRGRRRILAAAQARCDFERDAFGRVIDCEPRLLESSA